MGKYSIIKNLEKCGRSALKDTHCLNIRLRPGETMHNSVFLGVTRLEFWPCALDIFTPNPFGKELRSGINILRWRQELFYVLVMSTALHQSLVIKGKNIPITCLWGPGFQIP
jgi:hypothetical protein